LKKTDFNCKKLDVNVSKRLKSEKDIVEKAEKKKMFSGFYDQYKSKIYRLAYAYLHNKQDVDDLFQEILLNIWNNMESFRGDANMSTWAYRIAVNTAMIYNRKAKNKKEFSSEEILSKRLSDEGAPDKTDRIKNLHKAIAKLNKHDRLITLLLLEGVQYAEIAEITGFSVNNVGVKINSIKSKLSKLMEEYTNE